MCKACYKKKCKCVNNNNDATFTNTAVKARNETILNKFEFQKKIPHL